MAAVISTLLRSSLQPSSLPTYQRAWRLFNQFSEVILGSAVIKFPVSPSTLALFIAYLVQRNYAASTVNTYVSALGYSHRLAGVSDPTKTFFITEMLKGYNKIGSRLDTRLPITLPILRQIMGAAPSVATTPYGCLMFRAMCATAFFAFLRIGEITATSQNSATLHLNQLGKRTDNSGTVISYELTFQDFKHHYNQRPLSITLTRHPGACPVQALLDYISVRGAAAGPFFQTFDGSPVLRSVFFRSPFLSGTPLRSRPHEV